MKKALIFAVSLIAATASAEVPLVFSYQGKLTDSNGAPLTSAVHFKVQIYDPNGTCLLYEEYHPSVSLGAQGLFNLAIGSSVTDTKRGVTDPGLNMEKIFSNDSGQIRSSNLATCPGGYTPNATDHRRMKVTVTNLSDGSVTALSPMQEISMNPYALLANKATDAQKFQGKAPSDFIQTDSTTVNQANVKSLTDKVSELLSIVSANVSNKFQSIMTDYQGAGRITVADTPSVGTDAVNKNYVDNKVSVVDARITSESAKIAGKDVSASLKAPTASEDGKIIAWSNAQNKYVLQTAPSGASSITSSDVTTALGYTPQPQNSELTGVASLATTGLVQRNGAGSYTGIGVTPPMSTVGNNLSLVFGAGLKNTSGSLVADFATTSTAGKAVEANDPRLPNATCASGNFNRWNGTAWVCEPDQNSGGGGGGTVTSVTAAATAGNPISVGGTAAAPTIDLPKATTSVSGYLSAADFTTFNNKLSSITSGNVTTALGYTPQTQNSELTGLAGIATTGIVQRTGAGAYTGLGTTAPINVTAGNIGISIGTGLTTVASSIVPDFGTTAGKVAQGNDSRIVNAVQSSDARLPSSTCASGNKMRWDGSAWQCETDATGSGSSQWTTATNDIYYNTGNVGIGASSPDSALHVVGNARVTGQIVSGSQTVTSGTNAIDWNNGNAISTDYNCASSLSFANLRDGGTYTLVVTDTGTTACTFGTTTTGLGAGTVSYRFKPANAVRTASSHSVYTLMRVGTIVYVSWASGF